jgi:Skp family chaperone for outer membrane proteins
MLTAILCICSTVFCQQINLTGQQPGVVDLTVVTALHPLMSLYDFNRMSFVNVEFGLDAKALHEKRQELLKLGETARIGLEKDLETINREYSSLKQKQFILMNDLQKATDQKAKEELLKQTEDKNRQISELWQKRNLIGFKLANPDLMLPEQTSEMLRRIEKEVQETVAQVAEEKGFSLVLNAAMPDHGRRNMQRSFEILTDRNLSHAETDLYYAFLANSPESAQQKKVREHASSAINEPNGAAKWLEQSRQPAVQEQLPINPHPLVLKGGIDITAEVVKSLLKRYKCDEEVITRLETILNKRTGR